MKDKVYQHIFDKDGYRFEEAGTVEKLGENGEGGILVTIKTETNSSAIGIPMIPTAKVCPCCGQPNYFGDFY